MNRDGEERAKFFLLGKPHGKGAPGAAGIIKLNGT
jgi:hypothetical protein